ncbi:MAG: homoserine kinase [Synergistaceae bacterium]|nr:homoserine kinase [Synergistaceae bacterium]
MSFLRIKVPASSANLGSGFDTVGLALSLYNFFDVLKILPAGQYDLEIIGEGAGDEGVARRNGVIASYEKACRSWGMEPPGLCLRTLNAIPMKRGLGSSSSAIVGGVAIANELRNEPFSREELLPLMVSMEGHPDNVVPCCLGGMVVSCWDGENLKFVRMPPLPPDICAVVAVPAVELSTEEARRALPDQVPLKDAVYNLSRAALLAASWATGNWDNLPWAMDDRLHQPFRARLFPGGEAILEEVRAIEQCSGVAISGSGPSVLAFARSEVPEMAELMCSIFSRFGLRSRFFVLSEDAGGMTVLREKEKKERVIPLNIELESSAQCVVEEVISDRRIAKVAVLGVPDIPGVAARLFSALSAEKVGVEMIVQSVMRGQTNDIAFIVKGSLLGIAMDICRQFALEIKAQGVTFDTEIAKVALAGKSFGGCPSIPSRMFSVLAEENINIDMIAAADTVIACIVPAAEMEKATAALSAAFLS